MLSELRSPGVNLAALGVLMLSGVVNHSLREAAVLAGLVVFSAFAAGRVLGLLVDGMPSEKVLVALLVELVIAALYCAVFIGNRASGRSGRPRDV